MDSALSFDLQAWKLPFFPPDKTLYPQNEEQADEREGGGWTVGNSLSSAYRLSLK